MGDEIVAFRMHLPSEVVSHTRRRASSAATSSSGSSRSASAWPDGTLNIAVDLEPESILYTTLILFGASILAARRRWR